MKQLYSFPGWEGFANRLPAETAVFRTKRFPNGEWRVDLDANPSGASCAILASIAPPDERLLLTLLLAHTLKDRGAARVELWCPYLSYARQDRPQPGRSMTTRWLGKMLQASGVDSVLTVDLHSEGAAKELGIEIQSLSPAEVLADALRGHVPADVTLVAPDQGAVARCERLRHALGRTDPIASLLKCRTDAGVTSTLSGGVNNSALIVDDILDTGGTLVASANALRAAGVGRMFVAVSHGLFSGTDWAQLWQLGVERIVCLNSVVDPSPNDARIEVRDVSKLFAQFA